MAARIDVRMRERRYRLAVEDEDGHCSSTCSMSSTRTVAERVEEILADEFQPPS
jgi:hypothetical protein